MADEAFALSPIFARAAQPGEQDYEAISQAFMETSRGRWFLGEYAKRNRNADTRMVLDAVARIEETLVAQRQPQPVPDNGLAEALAGIRSAVDEARVAALDGLALEEKLAPVRKGSRIIREIAWRWREIGADSRICDLIDSQIGAIEEACGQIASINPLAAFEVIERRLADLGGSEAAPGSPHGPGEHGTSAAAPPPPSDEMLAALAEPLETSAAPHADGTEAAVRASSVLAEQAIATAEAEQATAEAVAVIAETADAVDEPASLTAEADNADDDAILDMIALEMSAEDPGDIDDFSVPPPDQTQVAELTPADPVIVAPEPVTAAPEPAEIQRSPQASLRAAAEPSLGSSLIARGILNRPAAATASDPLAPIRRMSQAEKIAFFS